MPCSQPTIHAAWTAESDLGNAVDYVLDQCHVSPPVVSGTAARSQILSNVSPCAGADRTAPSTAWSRARNHACIVLAAVSALASSGRACGPSSLQPERPTDTSAPTMFRTCREREAVRAKEEGGRRLGGGWGSTRIPFARDHGPLRLRV